MNINQPEEKHIPLLRNLWKEAFEDTDDFLDTFFTTVFAPGRCRCIFSDDIPVASLYWFNCKYAEQPVAYIYAIATVASHRGQGLCRQLMLDTHEYLKKAGYQGALLVPSEDSFFELYSRFGYQSTCHVREFTCTAEEKNLRLRRISAVEYASLRSKYLPSGSIIQEEENLPLLQAECELYAGKDFLLAAQCNDNHLYGVELLGNIDTAPGLVHHFKYKKGLFHTPGAEKPFAMYLPLYGSEQIPPSYFGFAFD